MRLVNLQVGKNMKPATRKPDSSKLKVGIVLNGLRGGSRFSMCLSQIDDIGHIG